MGDGNTAYFRFDTNIESTISRLASGFQKAESLIQEAAAKSFSLPQIDQFRRKIAEEVGVIEREINRLHDDLNRRAITPTQFKTQKEQVLQTLPEAISRGVGRELATRPDAFRRELDATTLSMRLLEEETHRLDRSFKEVEQSRTSLGNRLRRFKDTPTGEALLPGLQERIQQRPVDFGAGTFGDQARSGKFLEAQAVQYGKIEREIVKVEEALERAEKQAERLAKEENKLHEADNTGDKALENDLKLNQVLEQQIALEEKAAGLERRRLELVEARTKIERQGVLPAIAENAEYHRLREFGTGIGDRAGTEAVRNQAAESTQERARLQAGRLAREDQERKLLAQESIKARDEIQKTLASNLRLGGRVGGGYGESEGIYSRIRGDKASIVRLAEQELVAENEITNALERQARAAARAGGGSAGGGGGEGGVRGNFFQEFGKGFKGRRDEPYARQLGEAAKFSVLYGGMYEVLSATRTRFDEAYQQAVGFQKGLTDLSLATDRPVSSLRDLGDQISQIAATSGAAPLGALEAVRLGLGQYGLTGEGVNRATQDAAALTIARTVSQESLLTGRTPEELQRQFGAASKNLGLGAAGETFIADLDTYFTQKYGISRGATLETVARTGALGATAGFNVSELSALSAFAQARTGQAAGTVASNLNTIIARFGNATFETKLSQILAQQGISFNTSASGRSQLLELSKIMETLPDRLKEEILGLFGRGNVKEVSAVVTSAFPKITEQAQVALGPGGAQGQQAKAFNEQLKNFGPALNQLREDFDKTLRDIGGPGGLGGLIHQGDNVVKSIDGVAHAFHELPSPIKKTAETIGLLVTTLVATNLAAGGLARIGAITGLSGLFSGIGGGAATIGRGFLAGRAAGGISGGLYGARFAAGQAFPGAAEGLAKTGIFVLPAAATLFGGYGYQQATAFRAQEKHGDNLLRQEKPLTAEAARAEADQLYNEADALKLPSFGARALFNAGAVVTGHFGDRDQQKRNHDALVKGYQEKAKQDLILAHQLEVQESDEREARSASVAAARQVVKSLEAQRKLADHGADKTQRLSTDLKYAGQELAALAAGKDANADDYIKALTAVGGFGEDVAKAELKKQKALLKASQERQDADAKAHFLHPDYASVSKDKVEGETANTNAIQAVINALQAALGVTQEGLPQDSKYAVAAARAYANAIPGDRLSQDRAAITVAKQHVAEAKHNAGKHFKDSAAYWDALRELHEAEYTQGEDFIAYRGSIAKYNALRSGDDIAIAHADVTKAAEEVRKNPNDPDKKIALLQARQAETRAGADRITARAQLRSARLGGDTADAQAAVTAAHEAKRTATTENQKIQAEAQLVQAQQRLRNAHLAYAAILRQLRGDTTDPVFNAREALREALDKLNEDIKKHRGKDVIGADKLNAKKLREGAAQTEFEERFNEHRTRFELGKESLSDYQRFLQGQISHLQGLKHLTYIQRQDLNQLLQAQKDLRAQFTGQFNLGDIKLPTVYQVRRTVAGDGAYAPAQRVHVESHIRVDLTSRAARALLAHEKTATTSTHRRRY